MKTISYLIAAFLVIFSGVTAAETNNLIKNAALQSGKGKTVQHWQIIRGSIQCHPGYTQITPIDDKGVLLFQNLHPQAGKDYLLEYEIRTPNQAWGFVYIEAVYRINGKKVFRNMTPNRQALTAKWQKRIARIQPQPGWEKIYVAARTRGTGIIHVRNLRFVPAPPAPQALGGRWRVNSPHDIKNGILTLRGSDRNAATLAGIPIRPGKQYRIDFQATGSSAVSGRGNSGMHLFQTTVTPQAMPGVQVMDLAEFGQHQKFHRFKIPAQSRQQKIDLQFQMKTNGIVQFSNFSIKEIPEDATANWTIKLTSPAYRGIFFGDQAATIAGQIVAAPQVAAVAMRLSGSSEAKIIKLTAGKADFTLPLTGQYGKYTLTADFWNSAQKKILTRMLELRKVPRLPHQVTIAENNLIVQGQPYFPITVWMDGSQGLKKNNWPIWPVTA